MNLQVLVAGAGPVGLTMAMALKRLGVDVRIVDKTAQRTDKSKALVLWPRTLELLDIQGCAQPFVDAGIRATCARIVADGKLLVHVPFDIARSAYRYALMIPQSETERLLQEQGERLGLRVERGVELLSFAEQPGGVAAVLRHADGRDETVHADWLAACDGGHSTVRHGLAAATFDGETLPSNWVLADLELDGDVARDEITICWSQHGVLALFPIGDARFRVIADTGAVEPQGLPDPTVAEIQALLRERGPAGLHAHDAIWMSRFRINERKVRDYRYGRVFLAGDAAHVHSPAGGQGMNTGMQDAFNLAWKLAMVCRGDAGAELLDSYSPERSAIGEQVLRNAGNMTKVALISNPLLQQIRSIAAGALGHIPALRQRIVDQMTEVDLHYPDSPLTQRPHGAAHRPAPGERAPDIGLMASEASAARLHDVLRNGKFAVLSVGAERVLLTESARRVAIAASALPTAGYDEGHVYLVRPDAYVALSTRGDEPGAILAALERIAGAWSTA
jgi:2-polyprenyl-6-methoxyphenol hydroxylase-like FAD-dependent oxidoreductase